MPCGYCLLCGNRDKSASYYSFPKNKETRQKWLAFCGIDEQVLNTVTKLCWNHFQKDDIILLARCSILKHNVVPSIMRKNVYKRSDFDFQTFESVNQNPTVLLEETCSTINRPSTPPSCQSIQSFETPVTPVHNLHNVEFVSDNENPTVLLEETCSTVNRPSTPPSCESIQFCETPVTPIHNPRYFGDITTAHFATPRKAKIALDLAKRTVANQQMKIKNLQQARNRMLGQIIKLKTLLKYFKKKSRMCEMNAGISIRGESRGRR